MPLPASQVQPNCCDKLIDKEAIDFAGDFNELITNLFNTSAINNSFYWILEDIANASIWESF